MEKIAKQDIKVIVPSASQAVRKIKPFSKKNFIYDKAKDLYTCPAGNMLTYRYTEYNGKRVYKA